MKAKSRRRFDVDLTLFSRIGLLQTFILVRRTILTDKRRKNVKVFKEEVLEKWNRFLWWGVDCVNWSTASCSQRIQTLYNICIGFEISFHSDGLNSHGPSKGVCQPPSSFFCDKGLGKMSISIANMIRIEQFICRINHELLINDWRLHFFDTTTCSMNFWLTRTGYTVKPILILKLRSFSCLLIKFADVWSYKGRQYWLIYFNVKT